MESLRALGLAGQGTQEEQENVAFYEIYLPRDADGERAEGTRLLALEHAARRSAGRIWQQQRFNLTAAAAERPPWWNRGQAAAAPSLWGSTAFGDNVEDEWFVVWLLLELTAKLPGTTARVWDNDGEFLLIEAAYALPKWLKPDTAANRVWLRSGELHLVPLPSPAAPTLPPAPTVTEALAIVAAEGVPTAGSAAVQDAVRARTAGFADGGAPPMHRKAATLPARVAQLLAAEPQLVAPAVEAFYGRDVAAMKAAGRMALFPPEDLVTTTVVFNRCLYAQLKQQSFQAPPAYPMPLANSPAHAAAELGMKLTCGFEMLCSARPPPAEPGAAAAPAEPEFAGSSWDAFQAAAGREAAAAAGRGSSESIAAGPAAQAALRQRFAAIRSYERAADVQARAEVVIGRLLQEPMTPDAISGTALIEDSDGWLADSGAELEAELQKAQSAAERAAQRGGGNEAEAASGPAAQLDEMSKKLQAFLQESSSYEGADAAAAAGAARNESSNSDEFMGFDAGGFLAQLSSILGTGGGGGGAGLDDDDSDEPSDFYENGSNGGSDMEEEAAPAAGAKGLPAGAVPGAAGAAWGAEAPDTDTDSDDAEGGFMGQYSVALDSQLAGTHMATSFARVGDEPPSADAAGAPAGEAADTAAGGEGAAEELRPVDVDLNLVSNLLESFASQQGLPGPASNLAGMLGVPLSQLHEAADRR